jgi:hypothetical protein
MPIQELADLLAVMPAGRVPDDTRGKILELVKGSWHEFRGSAETSMELWKVDRERGPHDLRWDPPILSFWIVRHGGAVQGSTRGERQQWSLDFVGHTAQHGIVGYRQLRPSAPALDVRSIATKVCEVVREGADSSSDWIANGVLVWKGDGRIVIKQSLLIPDNGSKQTIIGRRRRFRADLELKMQEIGWRIVSSRQSLVFERDKDSKA